jgi:2-Cys peroxiredoxin 5
MKAWRKSLDVESQAKKIRFIGDATGAFTKAWDVAFDATPLLGNERSKRYAVQVEDGKVTSVAIEPDNTGISSKNNIHRAFGTH